jgi:hypothetical protein
VHDVKVNESEQLTPLEGNSMQTYDDLISIYETDEIMEAD